MAVYVRVLGISGDVLHPSKVATLVQAVLDEIADKKIGETEFFDLSSVGPEISRSGSSTDKNWLIHKIEQADILVVGTPVCKGSYSGLLKYLFDLVDDDALRGKPVILVATGDAKDRTAIIDFHLRPLFGFFGAHIVASAIYLETERARGIEIPRDVQESIKAAVTELPTLPPEVMLREFAFI